MKADLKYLALGDSYTVGEGINCAQNFPSQFADMLRNSGVPVVGPDIIAKTGWTSGELLEALNDSRISCQFDIVTLLIGVNNQYRGLDPGEYETEFRRLVRKAVHFAKGNASGLIVLSIPDWSVAPFAHDRNREMIACEIDQFNGINKSVALADGARYLDITTSTRRATLSPELICNDGLHPTGEEYRVWAGCLMDLVTSTTNNS